MPFVKVTDPAKLAAAQSVFPKDPSQRVNPAQDLKELERARANYLRMTGQAQGLMDKTTYGTTGWRAALANLPGINYVTEGMAPGAVRQGVEAMRTEYGIEKLKENPKMFSPLTEQEFSRVAGTLAGLAPYSSEQQIDTALGTFQDILTKNYAEALKDYQTRYGKLPKGFDTPTQNYPTIKSLPGFQPRPQQRK